MDTVATSSFGDRFLRRVAIIASLLIGPTAEAAGPDSWANINSTNEHLGPAAALPAATKAADENPESWALQRQRAEILVALGGPARARAAAESLSVAGNDLAAKAALFTAAMATGDSRAAQVLSELAPPPVAGLDGFEFALAVGQAALVSGNDTVTADSIATVLAASLSTPQNPRSYSLTAPIHELRLASLQADILLARGDAEEALVALSDLYADSRKAEMHLTAAGFALRIARLQASLGRPREAVDYYEKAVTTSRKLGHVRLQAVALTRQGYALEQLGKYTDSVEARLAAAALLRNQGDPVSLAFCHLGLGWVGWQAGDPDLSLRAGPEAAELFAAAGHAWGEVIAWENLGIVATNLDRYELAAEAFQKALALATAANNPQRRLSILNNLGVLYWREGRPDRAAVIYEDLLVIHRTAGDVAAERRVLNNMGLVSEQLGRFRQAESIYRRCVEIATNGEGETIGIDLSALTNLSRLALRDGRPTEAEKYALQAKSIAHATGRSLAEAEARTTLGRVYYRAGRVAAALAELRAADDLLRRTGQRKHRLYILHRIGVILRLEGQTARSLATHTECAELSAALHLPQFGALALGEQASTLLAAGEMTAALATQRACFATWERIRGLDLERSDSFRETSYTQGIGTLVALSSALADTTLITEAFAALQRKKARSLLDFIQTDRGRIRPDLPDSLVSKEQAARAELGRIRDALATAVSARADSLSGALSEAEIAFLTIRRQLMAGDGRFRRATTAPTATLDQIRRDLTDDATLVLDYLVGYEAEDGAPRPVLLFALDRSGLSVHELETHGTLEARVNLVTDLMSAPPAGSSASAALSQASGDLATALLSPVAARLARCRRLIVATDSYLHRLPFAALEMPDRVGYLVEQVPVFTVPNLVSILPDSVTPPDPDRRTHQDLAIWTGGVSGNWRTEGVVDGTTGSPGSEAGQREATAISSAFARTERLASAGSGDDPLALLDRTGILTDSRIVHFIAHGYFDSWQPWRSGLDLGPGPTGARTRLEIADLYYMPVDCELVTLSACETARGQLHPIDGLQGFAHALRASGARSVLATRWRIDSAVAPHFMLRFYENLADGLGRGQALRATQHEFIATPSLNHPFYWASFVMIGETDEPITLRRRRFWQRPAIWALGGGVLLLGFGILLRRSSI